MLLGGVESLEVVEVTAEGEEEGENAHHEVDEEGPDEHVHDEDHEG